MAAELIEGLENGTITLAPPPLDVNEATAEALRLAAEINATRTRYVPEYSLLELPTAEDLASSEKGHPGSVHEFLSLVTEVHAEVESIKAELRYVSRVEFAFLTLQAGVTVAAVAYFVYLCITNPAAALLGCFFALIIAAAREFRLRLQAPSQSVADARAKLLTAVNGLATGSRAFVKRG